MHFVETALGGVMMWGYLGIYNCILLWDLIKRCLDVVKTICLWHLATFFSDSKIWLTMQLIFFFLKREREQLSQLKEKIAHDNMVKSNVNKSSKLNYDAVEAELKSSTVGLVTLNDMKARQEALVKEREKQLAKKEQTKELMLDS
ncbi:unnamed protein product [Oncorhynchus mykiss]|uniref:Uncharacterized protein n=1 Tax=Oncorhynchus mykiss TaxID=8022 RepID=A0A060XXX5_ONCMY|nr:unnamed protein product [Oncorhynchus mykiss]